MGRVVYQDGVQYIAPLDGKPLEHKGEVLEYQKAVARLLESARAYSDRPSMGTLGELKRAAHNLAKN